MKDNFMLNSKRADYSSRYTTFMIQSIVCVIILLSIFCLKKFDYNGVLSLNHYLTNNLEWQSIYEILIKAKHMLLHYLR